MRFSAIRVLALFALFVAPLSAGAEQAFGPETNLPLPRYVSIKAAEARARRGPSKSHRIDWVFQHRHLPVQITAEFGHWRRIKDQDGAGGWVHYALLSGVRYVVIVSEKAVLRRAPTSAAAPVAEAEAGVVAKLGSCVPGWCEIRAEAYRGWVDTQELWGVEAGEVRD